MDSLKELIRRPFPYLDSIRSRIFLVLFCGTFASFFIYFFNPFNLAELRYDSALAPFLSIWISGFIGAAIIGVTQLILRPLFGMKTFTTGKFLLWAIFEFLLISLVMFLLFGEPNESLWAEYLIVLKYSIPLTVLPYAMTLLLIMVTQQSTRLQVSPQAESMEMAQYLFREGNGKVVLAIRPEQILYLKSENNYTSVVYLENDTVSKKLVRTTLKKLEQELTNPQLLRIHRSYMINLDRVESIDRNRGDFLVRINQLPDLQLKVSESYQQPFKSMMEGIQQAPIHNK